MRKISVSLVLLLSAFIGNGQTINIIPKPVEIKVNPGVFVFDKNVVLVSNSGKEAELKAIDVFNEFLKNLYGMKLAINKVFNPVEPRKQIIFVLASGTSEFHQTAYSLGVSKTAISIVSGSDRGESLLYGIASLLQLMPPARFTTASIPCCTVNDYPRFRYRGMHLDAGRHFFPVSFIKRYIDYLAFYKFNSFHWHLTEDQGWRIEIKKYPELTKTGSWRNGTIIGRYPGTGSDNSRYGGFYTQQEIKEIVKYAKDRYIDVIPEIEMPGHSSAAIAAYPWLSCFSKEPTAIPANMISAKSIEEQKNGRIKLVQETWGVFDDVFCAGNDSTFMFLENVIDEVTELFPSKYFHIGGDECPKTHWKSCPKCQARMKELGLKDEHELQSYFVQRIEKYLNTKKKILIGWDEILEGGLAPNAMVMSWRGEQGGIDAAKQGHDVIMTPGNPVYFDHSQSLNEDSVTIGGYNPIEKVYAYEPIPAVLNEEQAYHILGAQANVWTEYIGNERKVEYTIFPRMAALSEVLWSLPEDRNWEDFEKRLQPQFKKYEFWNAGYSKAYFDLKATVVPTDNFNGVQWKVETKLKDGYIGYPPAPGSSSAIKYTAPFLVTKSGSQEVCYFLNGKPVSCLTQQFHFNKATGKKITLAQEASKNYPGDGAFTLVNGVVNEKGMGKTNEFLGFSGADCDALIDLGESQQVSFVVINAFSRVASWIWPPSSVEISGSGDGISYYPLKSANGFVETAGGSGKGAITLSFKATYARYLKISIKNQGLIPAGNPGAGSKAWMFVDEIEVQGPQ